jgi:hypothetical protein
MTEGLREYDDSLGRCVHCGKLVFKDDDWVMPHYFTSMLMTKPTIAHRDCEQESMRRASQIGAIQI